MDKSTHGIDQLLGDASFRRWIEGTADAEEAATWDRWVAAEPARRELIKAAHRQLKTFSFRPDIHSDTDANWKRLQKKIHKPEKSFYWLYEKPAVPGMLARYAAIAAVLLIVAGGVGGLYLFFDKEAEYPPTFQVVTTDVTTDFGERKTIRFSDDTEITLNANSSLSLLSEPVATGNVTVRLRGEALFRVTNRSNSGGLFTVQTTDGEVRVLGTEFVVSNHGDETSVVLTKGSVEVRPLLEANHMPFSFRIEPGQMARFIRSDDSVRVSEVNTSVYTSWSTQNLIFDRTPLPEVIKRLEDTHGAEVQILDPELNDRRLSGTIENAGLKVIIRAIAHSLSIEYRIQGQQVFLDSADS